MAKPRRGSREGNMLAGKYRLDSLLGAGGMGEVYRAENTAFGRVVAIKMLREEYAENTDVVARFLREARAANIVRHPNVVDVLDIGQAEDATPFIVQEFLAGEDLGAYVKKKGGRLSVAEAVNLLIPAVDAVAFAHAQGVIHRDLKPENIFLAQGPNGALTPKLLDFGISRILTAEDQRMTATGMSIGTPAYMSPEQIRADKVIDARSDVWSLGVILHEILSGALPFQSEAHSGLFVKIVTEPPVPLDVACPGVPRAMVAIVDRCLRPKVADRYPGVNDLLRDLRAFADELAHGAPAQSRRPSPVSLPSVPSAGAAVAILDAGPSVVGDAAASALASQIDEVPDLALPPPKAKAAVASKAPPASVSKAPVILAPAPPSAASRLSSGMIDGDDFSDEIVPLSMRVDIAPNSMRAAAQPVARANRSMRESVAEDPNTGARSLVGMGVMWAIVLGLAGGMASLAPGGWSVVTWATALDGMPEWVAGAVAIGAVAAGLGCFVVGVRSTPVSWGWMIAAPGLIADGVVLGGFSVRALPSLTGSGGLDALARLFFPWPTLLVPLGVCLVAFRLAWNAWSGYRRPSAAAVSLVVAATALFGAVEIARGAGDVGTVNIAS